MYLPLFPAVENVLIVHAKYAGLNVTVKGKI